MVSIPVESTAIARLEYNEDDQSVIVTFQKGGSYILRGMTEIEVYRWANSESPGQYWNANVKGNY